MNKEKKLENIFEYIEKETDQSITDYIDMKDILEMSDYDDLYEELEEQGFFNVEIIYYATAMDYLKEHDTSLSESLELAGNMGYRAEDLNSEILASLLASQKIQESFYEFYDELEDILTNNE